MLARLFRLWPVAMLLWMDFLLSCQAIKDGVTVQSADHFPSLMLIAQGYLGNVSTSECSAVLVAPHIFLTAGHCLCRARTEAARVKESQDDPGEPPTTFSTFAWPPGLQPEAGKAKLVKLFIMDERMEENCIQDANNIALGLVPDLYVDWNQHIVPLAQKKAAMDENITIVAFRTSGADSESLRLRSRVVSASACPLGPRFATRACFYPGVLEAGDSGGAVLNMSGELLGVLLGNLKGAFDIEKYGNYVSVVKNVPFIEASLRYLHEKHTIVTETTVNDEL